MATNAELVQQGLIHHRSGQIALAMDRYTEVLRNDPQDADALYYIAVIACQEGQFQQGLDLARRSLSFKPQQARAYNLIGNALDRLGKPQEAIASYDEALRLDPKLAQAHGARAALLADAQPQQALEGFARALALNPNSVPDLINRGGLLNALARPAEALADFDKALTLGPPDPRLLMNRADALALLERYAEADAVYDAIIKRDPKLALAYAHKGLAQKYLGRFAEARALMEQAHAMDGEDATIAFALAALLLQTGEWKKAWPLFEKRAQMPKPAYTPLDYPRWNGEAPGDFRLVLLSEQGLGDTVQFGRYAALLAGRGHAVTLVTLPVLAPLMRTLPGVERVVTSADELTNDKRRVVFLPLMSTPSMLHLTPDTIPEQAPYLTAEPERIARWAKKLGGGGLKVGIVWQGVKNAQPLADFAPLAEIDGVRLISLQKGTAARQLDEVAFGGRIERPLDADDFSAGALLDTAAVMASLDLIVTIDSMPAHLGGALGRPVFLALPYVPDWRWLLEGDSTRWYPTMRLFRQDAGRQWAPVFARIADAVRETAAGA